MEATHIANPVRVIAATILDVTEQPNGTTLLRLSDGRNFEADKTMTARYSPVTGDYLVCQDDGYEYLNPKDVFERKYHPNTVGTCGDQVIESEIVAKNLNAPRITPADLQANIASEHYFNAADASFGDAAHARQNDASPLQTLTFCVLVLRNGFTVTGESACASPENFDAEVGRKIARQNAEQKIWPLLGYALKQKLHDAAFAPLP